ncbi:hypothetical protein CcaCcLH18_08511 [Colletotrichum camelliae]|nr:hypothetical protein CcaCcLH18_08511 [Colletotrichum camelliae]
MADPFSIVTGCVGLIGAAGATVNAITSFVRDCRSARGDLTIVARELTDLQLILELLKDDGEGDALPNSLQDQIDRIVKRCNGIVTDIKSALKRCKTPSGAITWAASEKKEVEALRRELATYRESLSLTIETTTLLIARSIKEDTKAIRGQTQLVPEIKDNTEKLLVEIQALRISHQPGHDNNKSANASIEEYLDGLTTYAETVCEDVVWETHSEDEEKEGKELANDCSAYPPTTTLDDNKAAEAEDTSWPAAWLLLKPRKCDICELLLYNGQLSKMDRCDHWLCNDCVISRLQASTRYPYYLPKCRCDEKISLQSFPFIDDKLKKRFNYIWGKRTYSCPRKTCGIKLYYYGLKSLPKRTEIQCWKCDYQSCPSCGKKWHEKERSKCKTKADLRPVFALTASPTST